MSMAAVLKASRDHLRNNIAQFVPGFDVAQAFQYVGIRPQGRPPPHFGEWFIGLDESRVQSKERSSLSEVFAVDIVITMRAAIVTPDRYDELYELTGASIDEIERRTLRLVHNNQPLRALACRYADVPNVANGDIFQQPLYYQGRNPTRPEDGEWIGAEKPDKYAFLVRTLPFAGMNRIQNLDIMH